MIWVDAQLSPYIVVWIHTYFNIECKSLRELGLRDAEDLEIFNEARKANAIIITKDSDFVDLINRMGPPPKIIWLTCGNTSNQRLTEILAKRLDDAIGLLKEVSIVEITN